MSTPSVNLANLAAEAAAENEATTVPLLKRDREPYVRKDGEPVTIAVLGEYSTPVRKAGEANLRRLTRRRSLEPTAEDLFENRLRVALAALTAWTLDDADGHTIPVTADNVRAVCELAPWILDQIEEAMRGHGRFFGSNSSA